MVSSAKNICAWEEGREEKGNEGVRGKGGGERRRDTREGREGEREGKGEEGKSEEGHMRRGQPSYNI